MRIGYLLAILAAIYLPPAIAQDPGPDPQLEPTPPTPSTKQEAAGRIPTIESETLSIGGDIDSFDGTTADRLLYEDHRIGLEAGQRLRISVISNRIDPLVQVLSPEGDRPLAEDDDSGFGLNARLIFTPTESGTHVIRVINAFPGLRGPYTLLIEPAQPFPDPSSVTGEAVGSTEWVQIDGELTAPDATLEGRMIDDYLVGLDPTEELFLRLDSVDFDPIVQVFRADDREGGFIVGDDDSGIGNNSLLLFRAEDPGQSQYVVRVTSFSQGATGEYVLRLGR